MVVGEVVAAAVDADCVDPNVGFLLWRKSFPSTIWRPLWRKIGAMRDVMSVNVPYDGPDAAEFLKRERAMFKDPYIV
jgi:hypothetical protein